MKIPDMNEKNTRAFLDKVRERASSYTPEWRMDLEKGGAGGRGVLPHGSH